LGDHLEAFFFVSPFSKIKMGEEGVGGERGEGGGEPKNGGRGATSLFMDARAQKGGRSRRHHAVNQSDTGFPFWGSIRRRKKNSIAWRKKIESKTAAATFLPLEKESDVAPTLSRMYNLRNKWAFLRYFFFLLLYVRWKFAREYVNEEKRRVYLRISFELNIYIVKEKKTSFHAKIVCK